MKSSILTRAFAALLAILGATAVEADDEFVVPPPEFVYCTVCHGAQVMGNRNIEAPRLSGLSAWYIEQQLEAFKRGWRGTHPEDLVGMEMQPMAAALSSEQIDAAAAWAASTVTPAPVATVDGDAAAGKSLYTTCAACHGQAAEGNPDLRAPALAGLNDWYMLRQLENYRRGIRGSHTDDTWGQQMQLAAALLEDDQAIRDVVKYITTLTDNQGDRS